MRRHISIIAVVCVLATLAGCTSKPANSIVEDAVRSEISEKVPERWVKAMLPGRNAEIALIEIQGWGEFNTDQKLLAGKSQSGRASNGNPSVW